MSDQPSPTVRVDASVDGDEFMLSVPGAGGELVRTGEGTDATRVTVRSGSSAQIALLDFGFPMVGTAHSEGNHLILCQMLRAPVGGRWDGTDLADGQVFVYPPGSMQVAKDPEGLRFGMLVVPWDDVERAAATLGVDDSTATRQHVRHHGPDLTPLFTGVGDAGAPRLGSWSAEDESDGLLEAAVRAACRPAETSARRVRRRWESRDLVADAIDWLGATGRWQVPMLTLCGQVGASERRLQTAFREVFDMTPTDFLRMRALQAAHRTLDSADPGSVRVADVSTEHGFGHRGRFAALYTSIYGRSPAATLRQR